MTLSTSLVAVWYSSDSVRSRVRPGSYGPGAGASPSPPTPFSYFSSGGAAAGTPAVLSVIPR